MTSWVELDERGKGRFAVAVVSITIVLLSIALRFWCKLSLKSGMYAEDWSILFVVPCYIAATTADLWGIFKGSTSKEITEIVATLLQFPTQENFTSLENYLKALYIGSFISPFGLTFIRTSLCLLFWRIFSTRIFRTTCSIVMVLSILWFIAAVVVNSLLCIPLDKFWNPLKKGQCLDFNLYFLLIGVFETTIDFFVLIIPISAIFTIQLPLKTKFIVSGIFSLGIFTIITNILRLYHIYSPRNEHVSLSEATVWTHIHAATAILCANLPLYRPIVSKSATLLKQLLDSLGSSLRSIRDYPSRKTIQTANSRDDDFRMVDNPAGCSHYLGPCSDSFNNTVTAEHQCANVSTARRSNTSLDSMNIPNQGILQTRKIEVY